VLSIIATVSHVLTKRHIHMSHEQTVMPCPPGATHPCCTERQLKMAKMQVSRS
jgi:hypothetical protein